MNKNTVIIALACSTAILFGINLSLIDISPRLFEPQTQYQTPGWVKNIAGWYSKDLISQEEYSASIQYLIDHGMIKVKTIA